MKKTILRIGNSPTSNYNTVGLHTYYINNSSKFNFVHVSAKLSGKPTPPLKNTILYRFNFFTKPKPKDKNFFVRTYFDLIRFCSLILFTFKVLSLFLKYDFKIIHLHSPMYLLIGIVGKIFKKKIYATYHGEDFYKVKENFILQKLSKIIDKCFTLSPTKIETLKKIHPNSEIKTVFNGIDNQVFFNMKKKKKKIILNVANFKKQKSHSDLVEAFGESFNNEYELYFAGEGSLKESIVKLVKEKKMEKHIKFLGYLNAKTLNEIYNEAEIFILPSYSEGFPKVILEAVATRCKIICCKVDAIGSILGDDYPLYMEPKNISSMISKIELAKKINDPIPEDYAKKLIEKYKWENIYKIYECEYLKDMN